MNNRDNPFRHVLTIVSENEGELVYGSPTPQKKDESLLNKNSQENHENQHYLDDLAEAVCINDDRLEKYEKMVTIKFGEEAYANMKLFVDELQRSIERQKFTNTSKVNLSYLGKNAGLSEHTIEKIVDHCSQQSIVIIDGPEPNPTTTLAPDAVSCLVLGVLSICLSSLIIPGLVLSLICKKKVKNSLGLVAANPSAYRAVDMLKSGQKTAKIGLILSIAWIPTWVILFLL